MNAYATTAHDLAAALGFDPESPVHVRRRLLDAIDLYGNEDGIARDNAIEAIIAGRAVFWSTAKNHSAVACEFLNEVNRKPIDEALAIIPAHKRGNLQVYLDTLVPLNAKAERELSLAYSKHTATWRDEPELAMRRVRDFRTGGA